MSIPSAEIYSTYMGDASLTYETTGQKFGLSGSQVGSALYRYRKKYNLKAGLPRGSNNGKQAVKDNPGPPDKEPEKAPNDPPPATQVLQSKHSLTTVKIRPGGARPYPRHILKAAVLDIEASDFTATGHRGFMICCSILPLTEDAPHNHVIGFGHNDGNGDKELVQAVLDDLEQYDLLIGHYILGYDLPWMYTRADHHGLPPLRRWLCFDTYYAARAQKLKTARKSMAFLLDHFGLENLKTNIYPRLWEDIRSSKLEVFNYARDQIVEHCDLDVIANRMLFDRLEPKSWSFTASPFRMTSWAGVPARAG